MTTTSQQANLNEANDATYPQQPIGRHRNTGSVEGYHPAVAVETMTHPVLTASQIRALYLSRDPDGHCFNRKTMRFFGDTMRNFRAVRTVDGYRLERRRPVRNGLSRALCFTASGEFTGTVRP